MGYVIDSDALLGKRFSADYTVVGMGPIRPGMIYDPDRKIVLTRRTHTGPTVTEDKVEISLGELRTLIKSGFIQEQ